MSDRIHFPRDTRLTTDMLNDGFDYLELADQRLLSDLGIAGIIAGLHVTPSEDGRGVAVSPGIAYDGSGRRIKVETSNTIKLIGEPQSQTDAAQKAEDWVSVLVKFERREVDPVLDRWGRTVAQRLLESCTFVVRPSTREAGVLVRAPAGKDEILVCDVRRPLDKASVSRHDLDLSRRTYPVVWRAAGIGTEHDKWQVVKPADTVQEAFDNMDAAISEHRSAKKVLVDSSSKSWQAVIPASTAQEALSNIDKAIYEQGGAAGIRVDSTSWEAIKDPSTLQEALSCLDAHTIQLLEFKCAAQKTLCQIGTQLEHLTTSPRSFANRLHAMVVFEAAANITPVAPRQPWIKSITVPGIRKGDVVLSMVPVSTTPEAHLSFEPIEVFADNFLRCRISTPGNLVTEATKVALKVVVGVAAPWGVDDDRSNKRGDL